MSLLAPLWLLPALLLLIAAFRIRRLAHSGWLSLMPRDVSDYLGIRRPAAERVNSPLIVLALLCLALASPAVFDADQSARRHASGWVIALDLSASMAETDISPSRLSAARRVAEQILDAANSRSVALILFAGDSFLTAPFSFDKTQLEALLQSTEPGMITIDGSNLYRALSHAAKTIDYSELAAHRVFLLSDAPKVDARAGASASLLRAAGSRVDIISFAQKPETAGVPMLLAQAVQLAESGGGIHLRADPLGSVDLNALELDKTVGASVFLPLPFNTSEWMNVSHWLLLLMLPLMLKVVRRS